MFVVAREACWDRVVATAPAAAVVVVVVDTPMRIVVKC